MKQSILKKQLIIGLCITMIACSSPQKEENIVKVHLNADAQMLNPICYSDNNSEFLIENIFQNLLNVDRKTTEITPILAQTRPVIEKTPSGGLLFKYKIRPEAKWDNGVAITSKDVEFSLKIMFAPNINSYGFGSYFEFIEDIKFDEEDNLSFVLVSNTTYMLAEIASGAFPILPKYVYDPKGLLDEFTIPQLHKERETLAKNLKIIEFANEFNSEKHQREAAFISGSGAYKLEKWITGQQIILQKKDNWWGNLLENKNTAFEANASKLIFQVIPDQNTALTALKSQKVDVSSNLKAKDFIELQKNKKVNSHYNFFSPTQLEYNFIGLNIATDFFADKTTRQAFAHLVNIPKIIEVIHYGLAEQIIGPVHPSKKQAYNNDIVPYAYNPEKAKALLAESGWTDSDNNGILEKIIHGKKKEFSISLCFNSGNEERKSLALILQEEARKAGIKINLQNVEASVYLDMMKNHKSDAFIAARATTPFPEDFKPSFHTSSIKDGVNYSGFGNSHSDSIIDAIRVELDESKRNELYKKIQVIMHDEAVYLFLFARTEKIAINNKFNNAYPSLIRPGYWPAGFLSQ